jgi:hypothetical protein
MKRNFNIIINIYLFNQKTRSDFYGRFFIIKVISSWKQLQ